jgi:hypothetical protein
MADNELASSTCPFCDRVCEGITASAAPYCLSSNIAIIVVFLIATILLGNLLSNLFNKRDKGLKLRTFYNSTVTQLFHVRKYIIILGLLFCAVRTLR